MRYYDVEVDDYVEMTQEKLDKVLTAANVYKATSFASISLHRIARAVVAGEISREDYGVLLGSIQSLARECQER